MKVDNLMIGNIVNDEDLQPMYIAGLWPVVKGYNFIDSAGNTGDLSKMSGIPLTPELLNKAGFFSVSPVSGGKYNFWNKDQDASIDVEIGGDNNEFIFEYKVVNFKDFKREKPIVYFHQLQNLHYALKGYMLQFTNQIG